jgi:hypothetical protein
MSIHRFLGNEKYPGWWIRVLKVDWSEIRGRET